MELLLPVEPGILSIDDATESLELRGGSILYVPRDSFKALVEPFEMVTSLDSMQDLILYGMPRTGKKHELAALAAWLTAKLKGRVVYIPDVAAIKSTSSSIITSALLFGFSGNRRIQYEILDARNDPSAFQKNMWLNRYDHRGRLVFIYGGLESRSRIPAKVYKLLRAMSSFHLEVASEDTFLEPGEYRYLKGDEDILICQPILRTILTKVYNALMEFFF